MNDLSSSYNALLRQVQLLPHLADLTQMQRASYLIFSRHIGTSRLNQQFDDCFVLATASPH